MCLRSRLAAVLRQASGMLALIGSGQPIVTVQPFTQILSRGTNAQLNVDYWRSAGSR